METHSWADDGFRFVFANAESDHELRVGDRRTGTSAVILNDPGGWIGNPVWAPGKERIMFDWDPAASRPRVSLIDVSGANLVMVAEARVRSTPRTGAWSPTASHLLYEHEDNLWDDSYLVRATASGGSKTRITSATVGDGAWGPQVIGWRANP
jgi:hypothetical protein